MAFRRAWLNIAIAAALTATFAAAACRSGTDAPRPPGATTLEDGGELGSIERLPGGTAVASDVRTLLSASCIDNVLYLRTSAELVTASMPCDRMVPQAIIDKFVSQTIAVRYADARLTMESVTAGTVEFPATDPKVMPNDATP